MHFQLNITRITFIFSHCLYTCSNVKASNHEKKTRNLCRDTLHWLTDTWTRQGHHWHHHFLSTREDFFFLFSAFTYKLQILQINTCLRALHKHPKENYLQIIHSATPSFSTLPTTITFICLNFPSWERCVSATDLRRDNAFCLSTLPTSGFTKYGSTDRKTWRDVRRRTTARLDSCPAYWKITPLLWNQLKKCHQSLNTDSGILAPAQICRKKHQNFTPDI